MRPTALRKVLIACLSAGLVSGTAAQTVPAAPPQRTAPAPSRNIEPGFAGLAASDKLLLMPIDIELYSLSAGGVSEPRADWTEKASKLMTEVIRARQQRAQMEVIAMTEAQADTFAEQVGLHAAVAQSISLHQFGGSMWALPTKEGQLLWSFHDAMQPLRDQTGADYALFFWVRDSYASPERVAAIVAVAILTLGHGLLLGGVQTGYASLVDLRSGDVVWFNHLVRAQGDLREPAPARESMEALLSGFPAVR
ncbi:MAG: hypothetical protein ABI633_14320 [Burkholderiales bacterium]